MQKWYYWLFLTAGFGLGGIVNYFDGRSIASSVIQGSVTIFLAITQLLCERKGEAGKKVFRYICAVTVVSLILWVAYLYIQAFAGTD